MPPMKLTPAKKAFVEAWGEMGSRWGITRTMAQIHALLLANEGPLSTDEIMEQLKISRGNAHMNIRDLVSWSLVRKVVRLGERKDYYEAEKDVRKIFCSIIRERKRREIDPLAEGFREIRERAEGAGESEAFRHQLAEIDQLIRQTQRVMEQLSRLENVELLPALARTVEQMSA